MLLVLVCAAHTVFYLCWGLCESQFDKCMGNACSWPGKKATRTKGTSTRHDAVSDTWRVKKKKRHFSRIGNTTRGAACISNNNGYQFYEPLNQQLFS